MRVVGVSRQFKIISFIYQKYQKMEKKNLDFEMPQVKVVLVEVEQGFAVSSADEAEQYVLESTGSF